jgi:phage host-nuclease inhibitor protein Gam
MRPVQGRDSARVAELHNLNPSKGGRMMASPRRKTAALEAPATIEAATALAGRYSELLTQAEKLRAEADVSIAQIEGARDAFAAPLEAEAKDVFRQLHRWWTVAGPAMTDGKRKSIELAGCVMGERTTTPMLKIKKGADIEELCRTMLDHGLVAHCITVKYSLNKPVIIADLRKPVGYVQEALICDYGLSVSQREEFFIDRSKREPAPSDPKIMEGDAG